MIQPLQQEGFKDIFVRGSGGKVRKRTKFMLQNNGDGTFTALQSSGLFQFTLPKLPWADFILMDGSMYLWQ